MFGVSDREMTARAQDPFGLIVYAVPVNRLGNGLMTAPASSFGHLAVKSGDLNRIRVSTGREIERMEKSVGRLDRVFSNDIVGCVTIIAGSRRVMT